MRGSRVLLKGSDLNEIGYTLCEIPGGGMTRGPMAEGTPVSVDIPVSCPAGSTLKGLYHTHPGGVAYPSPTDIRSAKQVKADILCVKVPGGALNCYKVPMGRR